MNTQQIEGKLQQVDGKIKQSVGEAVGNQRLANSGAADQVKGAAKETYGNVKEAAVNTREDIRDRATIRAHDPVLDHTDPAYDSADSNVRDSVVGVARKVRDSVSNAVDDMNRRNDRRPTF